MLICFLFAVVVTAVDVVVVDDDVVVVDVTVVGVVSRIFQVPDFIDCYQ